MRIENNAAAYDMLRKLLADTENMRRLLADIENRIRSAYNYGFKDGTEHGRAEAIENIVKYSMEKYAESEGIQLQRNGELPCNTCEYFNIADTALPCCECMYARVSKYKRRAEQ